MNSLLKSSLVPVIVALLASCGQDADSENAADSTAIREVGITGQPIIGERIKGPATIMDTVNGEGLFSLHDSTLVSCAEEKDGWCTVGLTMEIPRSDYGKDTLGKGRPIIVEGKVVGVVLKDMPVTTSSANMKSFAELSGYTHKSNIYPITVIENALRGFVDTVGDRSLEAFRPFIQSFALEEDDRLAPYLAYFNYESWIGDPSPMARVQLVFRDNRLIGVVHSRPLKLPNATDGELERGFRVAFFNDTPREVREDFTKQFNRFITSAD